MTDLLLEPAPAVATYPIPAGRGRWRATLHNREFTTQPQTWDHTVVSELVSATSRKLTQAWNTAAQLDFTLDGRSPECALVSELAQDVFLWRWNEYTGADVCVFRGPIDHTVDTITEDAHTVAVTCHDHLAVMGRRFVWPSVQQQLLNQDQDQIAQWLLQQCWAPPYLPGPYLSLEVWPVNPDSTTRGASGVVASRTYTGGYPLVQALTELGQVSPAGFDFDVLPSPAVAGAAGSSGAPIGPGMDALRLFYPQQGVTRSDLALVYGSNVATVTRTVDSTAYANYIRVLGNNGSSDPTVAQYIGEASNSDASGNRVGFWPLQDNQSAVSVLATLAALAAGDLALHGTLTPTYSLGLTAGAYTWGSPRMGETVPLMIKSGRLDVSTSVRVVGLTYTIGDDGQEDVTITVGLPATTLTKLLNNTAADINDLARR